MQLTAGGIDGTTGTTANAIIVADGTDGTKAKGSTLQLVESALEPIIFKASTGLNVFAVKNTSDDTEAYSAIAFKEPGSGATDERSAIGVGHSNDSGFPWHSVYWESFEGPSGGGTILPMRIVMTKQSGGYAPYRRVEFKGGSSPGDIYFFDTLAPFPNETPFLRLGTAARRVRVGYDSNTAIEDANSGVLQVISAQHGVIAMTITQDLVATGFFGFAANSNVFCIGGDGAGIEFRQNPTGTMAAGTRRAYLDLATGVMTITGGVILPTSNPGAGILWNNAGTPAIGT